MAGNRIAQAYIELRAEGATKTKAALGAVRKEVSAIKGAGDRSLGGLGDRLAKSTEGAQKLQSAFLGVIGVFTAVAAAAFSLGRAIYEMSQKLRDGETRAREFLDELRGDKGFRDVESEAAAVRDRLSEIAALMANADTSGGRSNLFDDTGLLDTEKAIEKLKDEVSVLEAARIRLNVAERKGAKDREAARDAEAAATERQAKATNESLRAQIDLARAENATGPQSRARLQRRAAERTAAKEIAEIERQIEDQRARPDSERTGPIVKQLQDRIKLVRAVLGEQIESIERVRDDEIRAAKEVAEEKQRQDEERQAELIRADKERADAEIAERQRVAQQTAASNIAAIQASAQAQADAARQIADLASSLSTLPTLISSLEGEVREIRGRLP